jgi:hypothetical protein
MCIVHIADLKAERMMLIDDHMERLNSSPSHMERALDHTQCRMNKTAAHRGQI